MTVHPRWRGEHARGFPDLKRCRGSSPLARGTHDDVDARVYRRRFIPAGAGNTHAVFVLPETVTVHPRWRGEHGRDGRCRARS